ncbi:hypothetical protein CK500_10015 [Halorubrum salipaludis]|uniref:Uncharacterized protein n=1 Tax=Halorubrum salipaludis TaxID=2032630 RepID=A0A2A2FF00_9EURY|nr:hypothetical protein CK500_10015 [Halorubrum salipaludis]
MEDVADDLTPVLNLYVFSIVRSLEGVETRVVYSEAPARLDNRLLSGSIRMECHFKIIEISSLLVS